VQLFKTCPICSTFHNRKKYCSPECCLEGNRRINRDRARARKGQPVDPDRPSKQWARFLGVA
jgi:hypothetical protein